MCKTHARTLEARAGTFGMVIHFTNAKEVQKVQRSRVIKVSEEIIIYIVSGVKLQSISKYIY